MSLDKLPVTWSTTLCLTEFKRKKYFSTNAGVLVVIPVTDAPFLNKKKTKTISFQGPGMKPKPRASPFKYIPKFFQTETLHCTDNHHAIDLKHFLETPRVRNQAVEVTGTQLMWRHTSNQYLWWVCPSPLTCNTSTTEFPRPVKQAPTDVSLLTSASL